MSAPTTVSAAFLASAARSADAAFLCVPPRAARGYCPDGAEFSYGVLAARAQTLASSYARAGYGHGHRVALLLENRPAFFEHYLALNALGVSIVPVNPDYAHAEVVYLLGHSDVVLAVAADERVADLELACADLERQVPVVAAGAQADPATLAQAGVPSLPEARTPAPLAHTPDRATECAMLYTSGTTGRPKGCMLSNEYFLTAGAWYLALGGRATLLPGTERVLNPLPLYHMNSLAITATGMLLSGGCLIAPERFSPTHWWADVRGSRATVIHYLGVIPPLLLNRPRSAEDTDHGVKFGLGAGVDPKHHAAFEARFGFPLVEVWGMTETGRILADSEEPRRIGERAFGRPFGGLSARVVDAEDRPVATGEAGELAVKMTGDDPRRGFFSGYYKNRQATEAAWRGGWFHTGDTVRQDASGMLYFIDRMKNIIRRSGENIAAAEVEAALQSHPEVAQAAVISVADPIREEEVFACIVPRAGSAPCEALAVRLFDWCTEQLAYFKAPGYLLFRDSLPTTGTQKVRKTELFAAGEDPLSLPGCLDFRDRKRSARRSRP